MSLIVLAGWMAVLATLGALATGYIAFGLLISRLLVWLPLVAASLYLLWLVVDDFADEVLSSESATGRTLHHAFGVRASLIDQVSVTVSAVLRLLLLSVATVAAFLPFGANLAILGTVADAIGHGVTIGQFTIAPGALLRAAAVLFVALFVVRSFVVWLTQRYLPKTELDAGARNSISTIARYVGIILALSWALAALGIGFQKIALILSALSVGIGFGLQAITQNFVSGLILLIERPVKIGDMVEVDGQKGDIKRISVRATEIQISDRSTLIVPNSDLVTKTVRNMTHADAIGVVQIKFAVPFGTDVDAVKALMLSLFAEAGAVFDTPAPDAIIESIDNGAVNMVFTGFCGSPRSVGSARSDILFRAIMELRARGIAIGSGTGAAPMPPAIQGGDS